MPTYKNNSTGKKFLVKNLIGNNQMVGPGESIETYRTYNLTDLDETSASPLFEPIISSDSVTSSGAEDPQEITVDSEAVKIEIINKSAIDLSVYYHTDETEPAICPANSIMNLTEFKGTVAVLVLGFSASVASGVTVVQWREMP